MPSEVAAPSGSAGLRIIFANRSIPFDGRTLGREPLGGVGSALVELPEAELHLFSGPQVYRMTRGRGFEYMTRVLAAADQLAGQGVRRHEPIARAALIEHVAAARGALCRGRDLDGAAQ